MCGENIFNTEKKCFHFEEKTDTRELRLKVKECCLLKAGKKGEGGGVLPCISSIGMCGLKSYGVWSEIESDYLASRQL